MEVNVILVRCYLNASSHVRCKRKRERYIKRCFPPSNARPSTVRCPRAFGHPNKADALEVMVGSSVLILGLWLMGRKRRLQEHRARTPKRVWLREIFRQRKIQGDYHNCNLATESITLIVEYRMLPDYSTNFSSNMMEEDTILVSNLTREAWNEYFYITFPCVSACICVARFTRLKYYRKRKSKRKEMENFRFLASALVFAFALRLLTGVFT